MLHPLYCSSFFVKVVDMAFLNPLKKLKVLQMSDVSDFT